MHQCPSNDGTYSFSTDLYAESLTPVLGELIAEYIYVH